METASTTLGTVVNTQQVQDLPLNGRAVDLLVTLAPGVVNLGPTTLRSMNGATQGRLWENGAKWLVDGGDSSQIDSDLADSGYGSLARVNRISVDAVAEFRLANSSYTAEYGASVGGVVNFISKSGTNDFHGGVYEFFRNEKLDARNYFNPAPDEKPAMRLNQYGGTIGGPIVRDKLFFFADYEGVRQRQSSTTSTFTPTAAYRATLTNQGLLDIINHIPLPTGAASAIDPNLGEYVGSRTSQLREDTWMAKVDWQASPADRFTFRHNYNWSFSKAWFGIGQDEFRPITSLPQMSKISYTRTLTPNLLNEAGFFLNRLHANTPAAGSEEIRNTPFMIIIGLDYWPGPAPWDMDVANTLFTYMDTLSYVRGRHQMKFGAQVSRMGANKQVNFQQYAVFLGLAGFLAYDSNLPFSLATLGWPRPGMRITQQNYFVQDDIQVSKRLTINAGLRYQYDLAPAEKYGRISNFNFDSGTLDPPGTKVFDPPKTNFGPRLGIAYSPFDSNKTVFRAGAGIYFANFNAADAQFLPTNVPGYSYMYSTNVLQGIFLPFYPFPDLSAYPNASSPTAFNKEWQAAYTEQWSFNIQQGFGESTVLQVGYVGNRGLHYSPIQQANPIVPGTGQRRFPGFGGMSYYAAGASTNYHALQATFKRRMSRGLDFNVNYTWAHSHDQGGLSFGPGAQNPDDYESEWASADYDVRHNLAFSYTYQFPKLGGPSWLGEGWQINGITVMRSGFPINVTCNCDPMGIGETTSRPDLVSGQSLRPAAVDIPGDQVNLSAFIAPNDPNNPNPTPHFGSAGRNLFYGPAAFNWDFSVFKRFRVTERQQLEFRAEVFNVANTPQFNNPSGNMTSLNFGKSTSTLESAGRFASQRSIQFGLKYSF